MVKTTPADTILEKMDPEVQNAFKKLAQAIHKEGALSTREKTLIALASSVAIRCQDCVKRHAKLATQAGASQEELLEAAALASLVRMGSGLNTASTIVKD
ncbi:MAG TPA: carboxymuconolactone decarboxylase family protein [Methanobacteriaceae archaeon]|jgi:AhpD family alkylhydroperoxidase|nr:carboxymuconolactone decarboxylase family protein [Euryarchaeota archaeon]HNR26768.1 carboxymuconolactone decarboxylase family protein [Methanobacteriaceae archaeon]HNS26213.1 carboxymuconolactone decarboxylase family protein [Methanobacteriaceae archaeon]